MVRDDVNEPGTGLVCFGSFAFADEPGDSVLVVPRVVVGRRGGRTWLTLVGAGDVRPALPCGRCAPPRTSCSRDGALDGEHWMAVVADARAPDHRRRAGARSCSPAT